MTALATAAHVLRIAEFGDGLRLVPSPNCQIFDRRYCQTFNRVGERVKVRESGYVSVRFGLDLSDHDKTVMPVGAVGNREAVFQRPRGRVCASTGRAASTGGVGRG